MASTITDYKPTFLQAIKGSYKDSTHFVALNVGTDAYVTEREMNELQWIQTEKAAETLREITKSGVLTIDDSSNLEFCFKVKNNDKNHLNGFELPPFKTVHNGYLTHHEYYRSTEPDKKDIPVRLPNPPVGGYRHDFVFIEFWFKELKKTDKVPKFGFDTNSALPFNILDERISEETSRRIQLQWTISHYEDYDDWCDKGFIKPDGKPNEKIHPLAQTGYRAESYYFKPVEYDPYLFRAGEGLIKNQKIHTVDGYVYAIPLFNILRYNNSGYDARYNPMGGIDYVSDEATPTPDRPDGKYSNIIYSDDIKDLRHLAPMSEAQYNKIYTSLNEYYQDQTILRNKIYRLTYDWEVMRYNLRNLDIDIPSIHDKEVYGVEMFHQWGTTSGGMIDPMNEDKKIAYHKHNKYYVGRELKGKNYAVLSTLIDYDWEDKGTLGDLYINKFADKFRVYNTGAKGLRMNFEALQVDGTTVLMGEDTFSGMDGTAIKMPFKLDDDRYFVQVTAINNAEGRNGEIFVKYVEDTMYVYNTGMKTDKYGSVTATTGNKFQWVVIDLYSDAWKNINYMNVTLDGQDGVQVSSKEFGEMYRLSLGTPIVNSSMMIEQGSIGDIYADVDEEDIFTVYNTGGAGATVQCLVFNDILYDEYYDTLSVKRPTIEPIIVVREEE